MPCLGVRACMSILIVTFLIPGSLTPPSPPLQPTGCRPRERCGRGPVGVEAAWLAASTPMHAWRVGFTLARVVLVAECCCCRSCCDM